MSFISSDNTDNTSAVYWKLEQSFTKFINKNSKLCKIKTLKKTSSLKINIHDYIVYEKTNFV